MFANVAFPDRTHFLSVRVFLLTLYLQQLIPQLATDEPKMASKSRHKHLKFKRKKQIKPLEQS